MKHKPVSIPVIPVKEILDGKESSWIKAVGYDAESKTLRIELHSGAAYHYHGVSEAAHAALIAADSIGTHLNAHIKRAHQFTRIDACI